MGLSRISQVADKLAVDLGFATVITVAGTNGKGTSCAFLENALIGEGKSVAVYSSPHIEKFNERLRLDKHDMADDSFIRAFELVEQARGEISLTYYEFTTLAAFLVLMEKRPDVIILEVGLGGRLDATNIIDADISVITTVDLDHQTFLGNDRESIGFEKAGIMRGNGISVVGDKNPPRSVLSHADKIKTQLYVREQDFKLVKHANSWDWQFKGSRLENLCLPNIPMDNVATALTVLSLLEIELSSEKVNQVIAKTKVAGRTEIFQLDCDVMLDVGHNPQATSYLASKIKDGHYRHVYAVVGMLKDKDITNSLLPMNKLVSQWYLAGLSVPRGAFANEIANQMPDAHASFNCFDNVTQAYKMALKSAGVGDLVVVFGSFFTVAEIRRLLV